VAAQSYRFFDANGQARERAGPRILGLGQRFVFEDVNGRIQAQMVRFQPLQMLGGNGNGRALPASHLPQQFGGIRQF
jgi:hypothetical protein